MTAPEQEGTTVLVADSEERFCSKSQRLWRRLALRFLPHWTELPFGIFATRRKTRFNWQLSTRRWALVIRNWYESFANATPAFGCYSRVARMSLLRFRKGFRMAIPVA